MKPRGFDWQGAGCLAADTPFLYTAWLRRPKQPCSLTLVFHADAILTGAASIVEKLLVDPELKQTLTGENGKNGAHMAEISL